MTYGLQVWAPDGSLILDSSTYTTKIRGIYTTTAVYPLNGTTVGTLDVTNLSPGEILFFIPITSGLVVYLSETVPNRIHFQCDTIGRKFLWGAI